MKKKLSINNKNLKQWWEVAKQLKGLTIQEQIPPLRNPGQDLEITSREKADLAHLFSQKMKTQHPDRQSTFLSHITASRLESALASEAAVREYLRGI